MSQKAVQDWQLAPTVIQSLYWAVMLKEEWRQSSWCTSWSTLLPSHMLVSFGRFFIHVAKRASSVGWLSWGTPRHIVTSWVVVQLGQSNGQGQASWSPVAAEVALASVRERPPWRSVLVHQKITQRKHHDTLEETTVFCSSGNLLGSCWRSWLGPVTSLLRLNLG